MIESPSPSSPAKPAVGRARLLVGYLVAMVVVILGRELLTVLGIYADTSDWLARCNRVFNPALQLVSLAGWILLSRVAGSRARPFFIAVLVMETIGTIDMIIETFWPLKVPSVVPFVFFYTLGTAATVVGWLALDRLVRERGGAPGRLLPVVVGVQILHAAIVLMPLLFYRSIVVWEHPDLYRLSRYLGRAAGLGVTILLLLRALAASRALHHAPSTDYAELPPVLGHAPSDNDVLWGGVWLVGGCAVTALSYSMAGPGEHVIVTTGLIAYGIVRLLRGLVRR